MSDILHENKLKRTKCRIAVLAYLETAQGPVTAEGLYQALSSSGTIHTSLSTVYRTVGALSEKGLLLKSAGADGVIHYQLNNSRHCHYLICTDCSQVGRVSPPCAGGIPVPVNRLSHHRAPSGVFWALSPVRPAEEKIEGDALLQR